MIDRNDIKPLLGIGGGILLLLVFVSLLSSGSPQASPTPTSTPRSTATARPTVAPTNTPDAAALAERELATQKRQSSLACDHFRNIMRDFGDGIMTTAELRTKIREVEGNANIATVEVQTSSRRALAAVTQDNADAFVAAVTELHQACLAAGH